MIETKLKSKNQEYRQTGTNLNNQKVFSGHNKLLIHIYENIFNKKGRSLLTQFGITLDSIMIDSTTDADT